MIFASPADTSAHPASANPDPDRPDRSAGRPDEARTERTERHRRMLRELAEIGMDLARGLRRQTLGEAADRGDSQVDGPVEPRPPFEGDPGLIFSRLAR